MKVDFVRTGGVTGIRLAATLDTETLPPQEADHLRRLIAAARVFDVPGVQPSPTRAADRFQYRVSVEDGDRKKNVEMDESSVPEAFRPLLEYLINSARTRQKTKRS